MSDAASKKGLTRSTIRFVLDGNVVEVENVDPTRTVLQYLREDLKRCGTKEGCAEGDCGACTVVLAEIDRRGNRLRSRAINSCIQFLPTLDGKELITVESLQLPGGKLHPVQQAMVDCHGSQCGFCTPGFVMSLFALYKNQAQPSRNDIDAALAGNLCRCTGYRPIVDAAVKMYRAAGAQDRDWLHMPAGVSEGPAIDEAQRVARLAALRSQEMLVVRNSLKSFFAPRDTAELATLCEQHPNALLLAGGTDVGLWVTKQLRELAAVIYTGNVAELTETRISDTYIEIGAAVSLTDAMASITEPYPSLAELFLRFASPPIRNAGTLGGNVANGSPIGDSMPALLVLDASLLLRSAKGVRTLPLADFYLGYQKTALRQGEYIEKILIPLPTPGEHVASYKVSKRFDQDISAVCAAFRMVPDGNTVDNIRIAYGGMAEVPQRASACEEALRGQPWNEATIAAAGQALKKDFTPITDMRSSAGYRQRIAHNLLRRFHLETHGATELQVYSYGR